MSNGANEVETMTDNPTAARVAEPMSAERIAELRSIAQSFWSQTPDSVLASQCDATIQCLNEIERLRAVVAERDAEIARLETLFNQMINDAEPERFDCDPHRMAAWVISSALNAFAGKPGAR